MTREEFLAEYGARPDAASRLASGSAVLLPCRCGESGCRGWAFVPNDPETIAAHEELYT